MALPHRTRVDQLTPTATQEILLLPSERARAILSVIGGSQAGLLHEVPLGGELLVGRDDRCELRLHDASVSRQHARLREHNGQISICDLGSKNGTFVNGKRLEGEEPIQEGAHLRIGGSTIKLSWMDELDLDFQRRLVAAVQIDPLTGLHNRRWLDERLDSEIAATARHGGQLVLLLLDVDGFKSLNRRQGPVFGDSALKQLADVVKRQLRREDMLARFGGDELAVLVRATPVEGATVLAERLRQSVATITLSVGIGQYTPGITAMQLVEQAQAAVYRAKQRGGDRVVVERY